MVENSKKIVVSSDEHGPLVEPLLKMLHKRGYETVYFGPEKGEDSQDWPLVTKAAIDLIVQGEVSEAIIMCWTGTGCSIVANKMPGIRAALCLDAQTAEGARVWNHANVLALSQRMTSPAILEEILDAWFDTPFSTDPWNITQIEHVCALERDQSAKNQ